MLETNLETFEQSRNPYIIVLDNTIKTDNTVNCRKGNKPKDISRRWYCQNSV